MLRQLSSGTPCDPAVVKEDSSTSPPLEQLQHVSHVVAALLPLLGFKVREDGPDLIVAHCFDLKESMHQVWLACTSDADGSVNKK